MRKSTDLLISEKDRQILVFKDFNFCISMNCFSVPVLEMLQSVNKTALKFIHWIDIRKNQAFLSINYREMNSQKLVIDTEDGKITNQHGELFTELKDIISAPFSLEELNYTSDSLIETIWKHENDKKLFQQRLGEMFESQNDVFFDIQGMRMELRPIVDCSRVNKKSTNYSLIITRRASMPTLNFEMKSSMELQTDVSTSNFQSQLLPSKITEIIEAGNLKDSVTKVSEYLKERFTTTEEHIIDLLKVELDKRKQEEIEKNPDILQSNYGMFYEKAQRRKQIKMKFKAIVLSSMFASRSMRCFKNNNSVRNDSSKDGDQTDRDSVGDEGVKQNKSKFSKEIEPEDIVLKKLKDHGYNILEVPEAEKPLHAWKMFTSLGLDSNFKIDSQKFLSMVAEAEISYNKRNNPYHNFNHGMTVLNGAFYFMSETYAGTFYSPLGKLAMLFAALMHDVDHTGYSNGYEKNNLSALAITYNDQSILENHHCATAYRIVLQEKNNIFKEISKTHQGQVREIVIKAILSTDVTKHFQILEKFQVKLDNNALQPDFDGNPDDHHLLSGMIIHTCDLYVPTKPTAVSTKWTALVNKEFINQNLKEKELGLPETPFYKNLTDIKVMARSENSFISNIVSPLWKQLDRFVNGELALILKNIETNQNYWKKVFESEETHTTK